MKIKSTVIIISVLLFFPVMSMAQLRTMSYRDRVDEGIIREQVVEKFDFLTKLNR